MKMPQQFGTSTRSSLTEPTVCITTQQVSQISRQARNSVALGEGEGKEKTCRHLFSHTLARFFT